MNIYIHRAAKVHIKHLFAYCHFNKVKTVDFAILTDDNRYFEYTVAFRLPYLSKYVLRRIRSMFDPYFIDKNTDILVSDRLNKDHPIYQYFMLLRQHIGFRMSSASLRKMTKRITYFYKPRLKKKTRTFMDAWQYVIDGGDCPWINQQIEYAIQNKGPSMAFRIRMVRFAMFYMGVKNHLYSIRKKRVDKKKNVCTH